MRTSHIKAGSKGHGTGTLGITQTSQCLKLCLVLHVQHEALRERGLIAQGEKAPNADVCAQMLQSHPDFVEEMPEIELEMEMHGHKVLWNPKYHAELNPIEMMWGAMKRYMRANTKESMAAVKTGVVDSYKQFKLINYRRWAKHARRFMRAYLAGATGDTVDEAVATRKCATHRSGDEAYVLLVLPMEQQTAAEQKKLKLSQRRSEVKELRGKQIEVQQKKGNALLRNTKALQRSKL